MSMNIPEILSFSIKKQKQKQIWIGLQVEPDSPTPIACEVKRILSLDFHANTTTH